MIEASYEAKINEIIQVSDSLNDWEKGFILGDKDSRPILERPEVSIRQKAIIDRIYSERVEGKSREESTEITFGCDRVRADVDEENSRTYHVYVDGNKAGPNVNSGEAAAVVGWLSQVITKGELDLVAVGGFGD